MHVYMYTYTRSYDNSAVHLVDFVGMSCPKPKPNPSRKLEPPRRKHEIAAFFRKKMHLCKMRVCVCCGHARARACVYLD